MLESNLKARYSDRIIGQLVTSKTLPTAVFIGGIHGNEQSGVQALERVFQFIEEEDISVFGNIIALRGNIAAANQGERFIDYDLNRAWTNSRLNQLLKKPNDVHERREIKELKEILDGVIQDAQAPVSFYDLHTTSSVSAPFVIIEDTIRNRQLSMALPNTKVLGILEKLKGTILGFYGDKGPTTLVFEAGQHDDPESIDRQVAAIYLLLRAQGIIDSEKIDYNYHEQLLRQASEAAPKFVETTYHQKLKEHDEFEMKPGFKNFTPVKKNQEVAVLNKQPIHIAENSYMFMPLYQSKGEDGFFLCQPISPFWINLSRNLRKIHFEHFLRLLPGVKINREKPHAFTINTSIAFFRTIDFFHLLGYRYENRSGKYLTVSRMPHDIKGPWD